MVKVESYIKVVMEMDVQEARELKETLGRVSTSWNVFDVLDDALKQLDKAGL